MLMQFRFILLLVLLGSYSCQPGIPSEEDELIKLAKAYELQPNSNRATEYLTKATEYIGNNKENYDQIHPILQKAAEISTHAKMYSKASGYHMALIRESKDPEYTKGKLAELGMMMKVLRKPHASVIIYKGLIELYPDDNEVAKLASEMDSEVASSVGYVNYLFDQVLVDPDEYGINRQNALKFVDGSEAFALVRPQHPKAPQFLYKAAEVARSLRTMVKAMNLYDWLLEKYPDDEKSPTTLFIKGFLLEQEFEEEDEARKMYEQFLEKYPNHEMASSAKFLLDNMGKSDEEILKDIEEKRKKSKLPES